MGGTPAGVSTAATLRVYYGPADGVTNLTNWASSYVVSTNATNASYTAAVSNLTPGLLYYIRSHATEGTNTAWATATTNFTTTTIPTTNPAAPVSAQAIMVNTNGAVVAPTSIAWTASGVATTGTVAAAQATADAAYLLATNTPMRPVAWVSTNGNNATAVLGNPLKPYASPWAAWSNGASVLIVGPGTFPGITNAGATVSLRIFGAGTTIGTINVDGTNGATGVEASPTGRPGGSAGSVTIVGNGAEHIAFNTSEDYAVRAMGGSGGAGWDDPEDEDAGAGGAGGTGGVVRLTGVWVKAPRVDGGGGGAGLLAAGGNGGPMGTLYATNCVADVWASAGGDGGGDDIATGGNGGDAGSMTIVGCKGGQTVLQCGNAGGDAATIGSGGTFVAIDSTITGRMALADQDGRAATIWTMAVTNSVLGYFELEDAAADGSMTVTNRLARVTAPGGLCPEGGGAPTTATLTGEGRFCDITTPTATPEGIAWYGSIVDNVWTNNP
jgi:hypothetical protein